MRFIFGLFAALVVAAGAGVAYLNVAASEVAITNTGRVAIPVRGHLPPGTEPMLAVLGVRNLPDELLPGGPATVRLPKAVGGDIDATQPSVITVSVLGRSVSFSSPCASITLNGSALLGQRTTFSVGDRARHELNLACS